MKLQSDEVPSREQTITPFEQTSHDSERGGSEDERSSSYRRAGG